MPSFITYTNSRQIDYDYGSSGGIGDRTGRIAAIKDGATVLAGYTYLGSGRVVRIDYEEPEVRLDLWGGTGGTYAGIDRFGRVVDQRWHYYGTGAADRDRFAFGYDRNSNRIWRQNQVGSDQDEHYTYDKLDRLTSRARGTLTAAKDGIDGVAETEESWGLDILGNWDGYVTKLSGTTTLDQTRDHNKANEVTEIDATTGTVWVDPVHDRAGNMTTMPKPESPDEGFRGVYDAWNRLVKLTDDANNDATVAEYEYDGMLRRIVKKTYDNGQLAETRHYYYSLGWQVVEERVGSGTTAERQFVWGVGYLDELILRDRGSERLYALQDANYNVAALVNTSGSVVERFAYDAYGQATVMDGTWGSRSASSYDWEVRFGGYRWDVESGLYQQRFRFLHPVLGRWVSRDPLEYVDGMSLYEYVGSNSVRGIDTTGLHRHEELLSNPVDRP